MRLHVLSCLSSLRTIVRDWNAEHVLALREPDNLTADCV
jgi:hypothetical protein